MISARICFFPDERRKDKNLILDAMENFGKSSGIQTNNTNKNTQLDAIVLGFKEICAKYMKIGGFRLSVTLYYTSNQCTPSNDPLKMQINLPIREL